MLALLTLNPKEQLILKYQNLFCEIVWTNKFN